MYYAKNIHKTQKCYVRLSTGSYKNEQGCAHRRHSIKKVMRKRGGASHMHQGFVCLCMNFISIS